MTSNTEKSGILERMILFITQRKVVREVSKRRWSSLKNDQKIADQVKRTDAVANRQLFGLEEEFFVEEITNEQYPDKAVFDAFAFWELPFLFSLIKPELKSGGGGRFTALLYDTVDACIENGYLQPNYNGRVKHLKTTLKGHELISRFYYLKMFYNSKPVQLTLTVLIQWGIPIFALWVLSNFFNVSIQSA